MSSKSGISTSCPLIFIEFIPCFKFNADEIKTESIASAGKVKVETLPEVILVIINVSAEVVP